MTDLTYPVYVLTTLSTAGHAELTDYASEQEAIAAAIDAGVRASPPGTTAEIGTDAVLIRFAGTTKTLTLAIVRADERTTIYRGERTIAQVHRERRPVILPRPEPLDELRLKDQPWSVLQDYALAYARLTLPSKMVRVLEAVAAGRCDPLDVAQRVGVRYRALPIEFNDDPDNPDVVETTPKAIRVDAHRAANLARAWETNPAWGPLSAIRDCDEAWRVLMRRLCDTIQRELGLTS